MNINDLISEKEKHIAYIDLTGLEYEIRTLLRKYEGKFKPKLHVKIRELLNKADFAGKHYFYRLQNYEGYFRVLNLKHYKEGSYKVR